MIIIPKGQYHRFNITDRNSYERYVLNFFDSIESHEITSEVLTEISMIVEPPKQIIRLLHRLKECCDFSFCHKEQEMLLKSVLFLILLELKLIKTDRIVLLPNTQKTLVSRILEYIGSNYTKQISIDDIAGALGVSNTNLAKHFRDEMGISVHRYIVEKRLVYAYEKISKGENPTKVCYLSPKLAWARASKYKYKSGTIFDFTDLPRPHHSIGIVIEGTAEFHFANEVLTVSPGELIFVPLNATYISKWSLTAKFSIQKDSCKH